MKALWDVTLAGDDQPVAIADRPQMQEVQTRRIGRSAGLTAPPPSAERCLRVGHVTAASVLSMTGDHGPLPDEAEMRRLLGVSAEAWPATR